MKQYLIAPSILSADFARLGEDTAKALAAGADVVHFDVMDNHYVPNLTIGPMVLKSLRNYGITAPIDVHLMVKPVDRIIPDFAEAGASIITFHPEASEHVDRSLQLIKEHGCKAGLVFNPATPLSALDHVMDLIDLVLVVGELRADNCNGRHQTRQHRADARDLVVDVHDDPVCRRPHILHSKRLHTKQADAQQKQQAECIKTI